MFVLHGCVKTHRCDCVALQVMGAPLAGSDVRAYVMTGGGMRFKGWWPRYRARRVQMIFPLKGADKRGLVSLEAKKRQARKHLVLAAGIPGLSQTSPVHKTNSCHHAHQWDADLA